MKCSVYKQFIELHCTTNNDTNIPEVHDLHQLTIIGYNILYMSD